MAVVDRVKFKALLAAAGALILCVLAARIVSAAEVDGHIVDVTGNTVVAFFPPVSDAEMESNPDLNEALSDFQLYTSSAREPLRKEGVEFQVLYVHSFRIRMGNSLRTFRPEKIKVGYYFIAPGKKPRAEYGVMTADDLVQAAREYFDSRRK